MTRARAVRWMGFFAMAALGACGGGGDDTKGRGGTGGEASGDGGTPEPGGTAIVAELSDISKPHNLVAESNLDGEVSDIMFMGLTRGQWRDGRLVYVGADESPMALARRWELMGPDSASLRFHMRSDVQWSDGRPVTAADVKWTYDMLADPRVAAPQQDYAEHIDSVTVEDDSTVTFHFDRRYPEMLFYAGIYVAPRHAFEGVDPAQIRNSPALTDPQNGRLPVTGPFMIGTWTRGERVTLVRNPRFRPQPHLESIVIRVIPEVTTRLVELRTGNVDMTRPIPTDEAENLRGQGSIRFERQQRRTYDYIGYNPRNPLFADPEVRLALGLAVDKEGIIQALRFGDFGEAAGGPYAPIFRDVYDPRTMAPLPFDTARAKQVLASRGWRDSDGDGVLDRNGRPFRFTLITNSGNSRRADVSTILQQQWKRIGVDARLQQVETNTFNDRLREKDFEAALAGWAVGLSPDIGTLWEANSPFNFVSYDNARTFALFDSARAQPTAEAANAYWSRAAAQIVADRPYTWLYYLDIVVGVNDRLKNTRIDTFSAYQNTWEWWIPRAQQRGSAGQRPAAPAAAPDSGK